MCEKRNFPIPSIILHHLLLLHLLLLQYVSAICVASAVVPPFNSSAAVVSFHEGFTTLFGEPNIITSNHHPSVQLHLNQLTGSGFRSSNLYKHGFFSARIKLPSDYTAGIVVAFYTTNGDIFEKTHDELDFEFLGDIRGKAWRFQTNMYGNGSTSRGREERYHLWFDPSKDFHHYTILWTSKNIIFYIDDVPIREIVRNEEMGADFPSKPMSLYATIWDASDWATSGGKYKVNYKYAPFVAEFTDLTLPTCAENLLEVAMTNFDCAVSDEKFVSADFVAITPKQRVAMEKYREKYIYYSYCYDVVRYPVPPPECIIDPIIRGLFKDIGRPKFDHHRKFKKRDRVVRGTRRSYGNQADV